MINITVDFSQKQVNNDTHIIDLNEYIYSGDLICGAFVNNEVKSLKYILQDNDNVELISYSHPAGRRIYQNSLIFLFAKAIYNLYNNLLIDLKFSLSKGVYVVVKEKSFSKKDVEDIKKEIKRLIDSSLPIVKSKYNKDDVVSLLSKNPCTYSEGLIKYVSTDNLTLYELDGFYGYFYTKMLTNTSQLKTFDLIAYDEGLVLLLPDNSNTKRADTFINTPKLFNTFKSYYSWCNNVGVNFVYDLNRKIENGEFLDIITVAEARHEQNISNMANEIIKNPNKRIVLIAGPSSSGKTTTSKRLRAHLIARGLKPVTISLDNYFVNREYTPKDESGNYDFESINALDTIEFNKNLKELMENQKSYLPIFDFIEGKRKEELICLEVDKNSPIIIEGIHGLNDRLTHEIANKYKYKIYINDLFHLNIDAFNIIPTSDVRLIRRIVRDNIQRGHNALATISMWQSVRRGEDKNIFPFSENADYTFNSSLLYEMSVLKKYALPALDIIKKDNKYFYESNRLTNLLSFFADIKDDSLIYSNSLLREFIGGNIFDKF